MKNQPHPVKTATVIKAFAFLLFLCGGFLGRTAFSDAFNPGPQIGSESEQTIVNMGVSGLNIVSDRWTDTSSLAGFGESAAALMNATSDEDKALALFRAIQQSTMIVSAVPKEPAYGITDVLNPGKQLNVYGAHWCDGFTRLMEMTWRALGFRAQKMYKFGHTLADIHYRDADGIERWHTFDNSAYHWYLYNRTGDHIATPEELILDQSLATRPSRSLQPEGTSLPVPSYIHEAHKTYDEYSALINLKKNESVRLLWGNVGKPYYIPSGNDVGDTDFEHGPYPKTYGNAVWRFNPDFASASYQDNLESSADNITSIAEDGFAPNLHPASDGTVGSIVYKFDFPYIISDVAFSGSFKRTGADDFIRLYISNDGTTWKQVWTAGATGVFSIENYSISEPFDVNQSYPAGMITPFGHYSYYLKIEMGADSDISECGINTFEVKTVTQHNIFSLPQLWPINNTITLTGEIKQDTALRITYQWDDLSGNLRENVVVAESLPYSYTIRVDGEKWEDVVCRSILIEAVPRTGQGNQVLVRENPPANVTDILPQEVFATSDIVSRWVVPELKTVQQYIEDIHSGLAASDFNKVQSALAGLAVLRDPSARQAILDVIYYPTTRKYYTKYYASQALYLSVGAEAAPAMIDILERDPAIGWTDVTGEFSDDGVWLWTCPIAAFILADINNQEARNAVSLISDLVDTEKLEASLGRDPMQVYRWAEIRWGLIKTLGILGGTNEVSLLIDEIAPEWTGESSYVAVQALGILGNTSAIPAIQTLMNRAIIQNSSRMKILYSIEALGNLGDTSLASKLYDYLNDWDENLRGYSAVALGKVGSEEAIPFLESMIAKEPFQWVKDAANESLTRLGSSGSGPEPPTNLRIAP